MSAASRVKLLGLEADDGELRAAGEALMRVPAVVDQAHRPLQAALTRAAKDVTALLGRYRTTAREVSAEAVTAHRNIDAARRQLLAALGDHVAACRAFEGVLAERQRRHPTRGPEDDPWATERRLVQEQQALQQWQDRERALLKTGFQRVTELEQRRLELSTQVGGNRERGRWWGPCVGFLNGRGRGRGGLNGAQRPLKPPRNGPFSGNRRGGPHAPGEALQ
jgi:hypothetical protein